MRNEHDIRTALTAVRHQKDSDERILLLGLQRLPPKPISLYFVILTGVSIAMMLGAAVLWQRFGLDIMLFSNITIFAGISIVLLMLALLVDLLEYVFDNRPRIIFVITDRWLFSVQDGTAEAFAPRSAIGVIENKYDLVTLAMTDGKKIKLDVINGLTMDGEV